MQKRAEFTKALGSFNIIGGNIYAKFLKMDRYSYSE